MQKHFLKIFVLAALLLACLPAFSAKSFTLVIDAGHGGKDAGAVGAFSKEKNINLNIALALGRLVEANCPDVRVIYTRKTDVFIPLGDRPNIANKAKADLFISVHTNSVASGHGGFGVETYTLTLDKQKTNLEFAKRENSVITLESDYKTRYEGFDPNKAESYIIFEFMQNEFMKQSVELAKCIQRQYVRTGRKDKGVKQANLLVLRNTTMPAVLTEVGFISNPEEEQFLNSKEGINIIATSIYNGFLQYRRTHGAKAGTIPPDLKISVPTKTAEQAEEPQVVPVKTSLNGKEQNTDDEVKEKKEAKEQKEIKETKEKPVAKKEEKAEAKPKATPQKEEKPAAKVAEKPKKEEKKKEEKSTAKDQTVYKIQFATTSNKPKIGSKEFKGLKDIDSYKEAGLYKLTTGSYTTMKEARAALKEVREKYPDAFLVTFRNGERVK